MASTTQIVNRALQLVGQEPISSLDESTPSAKTCKLAWDDVKNAVLRSHAWASVSKRVRLSRLAETPAWEFQYYYQLPSDFLRIVEVEPQSVYTREGNRLLSNEKELSILYVHETEDVNLFGPILSMAIAYKLASEIAYKFTASTSLEGRLNQKYEDILAEARGVDAREKKRKKTHKTNWLKARRG